MIQNSCISQLFNLIIAFFVFSCFNGLTTPSKKTSKTYLLMTTVKISLYRLVRFKKENFRFQKHEFLQKPIISKQFSYQVQKLTEITYETTRTRDVSVTYADKYFNNFPEPENFAIAANMVETIIEIQMKMMYKKKKLIP